MKIEILKAKIVKGATLSITGKETAAAGASASFTKDYDAGIHPDLKRAFDRLNVHLALMDGRLEAKQITNIEEPPENLLEPFTTTGFSLGKEGDGIVLIGNVKLKNGKVSNFPTPYYLIDENPETRYPFMDDLVARINRCKVEIDAYITGKKRGQGTLDFDEKKEKVKNIQVTEPENITSKDWTKASPDAMERVKHMDVEDAQVISETKNGEEQPAEEKAKRGRKKKVAQSAENPDGEILED